MYSSVFSLPLPTYNFWRIAQYLSNKGIPMSLLTIENVSKVYSLHSGSHKALNQVSFTVEAGEIISLLGVNGAGKTTLSSIIATLHPATSGDIKYKGTSIYKDIPAFRRKLGYCPQKPNLHPLLTLEQNLVFAGRLYGISESKLHTRINKLVEQFELQKYLHDKAEVLSGGYKQRFMIARSLLHQPEIVILDEPTVGLDPHIRRQLWEIIKELKKEWHSGYSYHPLP